ncbi:MULTISPECIES: hypothetical protein [Thermodesulfovibrio]|jgi:flagellar export protein FliJ|uniref:hypothetical protein n=1 Tax=Thermodesulfovibrio TaxID=28261 RepID=UPI0026378E37|nr:hypothetical protein [Thermodesulfovibrio sp.]
MNTTTLSMILKIREWQEETEKQKFASLLSERRRMEMYLREIEERFQILSQEKISASDLVAENINVLYSEIEYLTDRRIKIRESLKALDEEIEKQRETYEEAFKERRKVEELYYRAISEKKAEVEKNEEKATYDILMSRYRS